ADVRRGGRVARGVALLLALEERLRLLRGLALAAPLPFVAAFGAARVQADGDGVEVGGIVCELEAIGQVASGREVPGRVGMRAVRAGAAADVDEDFVTVADGGVAASAIRQGRGRVNGVSIHGATPGSGPIGGDGDRDG